MFELGGDSVAVVSKEVVLTSVSAVAEALDVGKGSSEIVWPKCGTELVVVFCAWLAVDSSGEADSTTCGGTETVVYVVDVIVTVPTFWSPNVQKEVGAPLI